MSGGHWEFWLNMINIALGAITVLAVLVVVGSVVWEVAARRARRARVERNADAELKALLATAPDSRFVPGLGLTMADGGERIEPSEPKKEKQQE